MAYRHNERNTYLLSTELDTYGDQPVFAEFGKKAYIITCSRNETKYFKEKCPCCGDTKKIQYNGFEVKCSICATQRGYISLENWHVEEYIVNDIRIVGPDYKKCYDKDHGKRKPEDYPRVTEINGFHRTANGYNNVLNHKIPIRSQFVDPEPNTQTINLFEIEQFAFTTKAKADAVCEAIRQKDRDALMKFNQEHGTNHLYPF